MARPPGELLDLDLAWRLVRGVTSNAIVLVKDGRLVGLGSGQTSRVDAARQAVERARAISGPASLIGAACGSDAFFPFPDAVETCLAAGRHGVRPARRLGPRLRGDGGRGCRRRDDAPDRDAPFPPLRRWLRSGMLGGTGHTGGGQLGGSTRIGEV